MQCLGPARGCLRDMTQARFKPLLRAADLAIMGAPPLFAEPRHVTRPVAPDRASFDRLMDEVWESRRFTNDGPLVQMLEHRLSAFLDVPQCVLTSSAASALDLVMRAIGARGEVLLPSYTFISTAHSLHLAGLTPVFCDVTADMTLDPVDCARRITDKTTAIVATHIWGKPCDIDGLQALCEDHGLALVFDAAHAFGSRYQGQRLGRFGRAEVFSLHATKAFHACEGGLITTMDPVLAQDLRQMRNFGLSGPDRVMRAGVNAKMSELHAAMGLCNLDAFEHTRAAARHVHDIYHHDLADIAGVHVIRNSDADDSSHHYVVAEVDSAQLGLTRDALYTILQAENILARRYFAPGGHRTLPHSQRPDVAGLCLPVTERLCDSVLVLPGGAACAPEDARQIAKVIRLAADQAKALCKVASQPIH